MKKAKVTLVICGNFAHFFSILFFLPSSFFSPLQFFHDFPLKFCCWSENDIELCNPSSNGNKLPFLAIQNDMAWKMAEINRKLPTTKWRKVSFIRHFPKTNHSSLWFSHYLLILSLLVHLFFFFNLTILSLKYASILLFVFL